MKPYIYIANWKMYFSYDQAYSFCIKNKSHLETLATHETIILCPDFCSIHAIRSLLAPSIAIGAQNCSSHTKGAYTAQVPATTLKNIGAHYCIIGHSECRTTFHESPEDVAEKLPPLLQENLTPIVCIGEALEEELMPILRQLVELQTQSRIFFAYEPTFAIGSGQTAPHGHIITALDAIKSMIALSGIQQPYNVLYGGSVNPETIASLKMIEHIDGFLIGKASTNYEQLQAIITG